MESSLLFKIASTGPTFNVSPASLEVQFCHACGRNHRLDKFKPGESICDYRKTRRAMGVKK